MSDQGQRRGLALVVSAYTLRCRVIVALKLALFGACRQMPARLRP